MFSHLLAGELVFLLGAKIFGLTVSAKFLIAGAFFGIFPDFLSMLLNRHIRPGRHFHKHRDNISHSFVLPLFVFLVGALVADMKLALLAGAAVLTHSLLDLYGIGWGVKFFLPFSGKIYKLFYRGRKLYVFKDDQERERQVEKYGVDDWFQRAYLAFRSVPLLPRWWGLFEWGSLVLAVYLIVSRF